MFGEYTARLVTFHTLQGSKIILHNWVLVIFLWCSFILSLLIHHLLVNLSMNFTLHVQDTDNFAIPNAFPSICVGLYSRLVPVWPFVFLSTSFCGTFRCRVMRMPTSFEAYDVPYFIKISLEHLKHILFVILCLHDPFVISWLGFTRACHHWKLGKAAFINSSHVATRQANFQEIQRPCCLWHMSCHISYLNGKSNYWRIYFPNVETCESFELKYN